MLAVLVEKLFFDYWFVQQSAELVEKLFFDYYYYYCCYEQRSVALVGK